MTGGELPPGGGVTCLRQAPSLPLTEFGSCRGQASSALGAHRETEDQKAQGLPAASPHSPLPVTSTPPQPCLPEPKAPATLCLSGHPGGWAVR